MVVLKLLGRIWSRTSTTHRRQIPISECVVGGTFVIRCDLAERLQGFHDIAYGDDADFFARAEKAGATIHKIDIPTYRYNRSESDSLTAIAGREGIEGIAKFREIQMAKKTTEKENTIRRWRSRPASIAKRRIVRRSKSAVPKNICAAA